MNESTFIGLANNAALLVALGLVFDTVVLKPGYEKTYVKILAGIVFGILGIAVMMTPWEFIPGVNFDTRSVILSIGGLFFGILPTFIAVLMTSVFRMFQGGIGAWTGTAVIITSGLLGILWRHKRKRVLDDISLIELYVFGVVVHIAMLIWMLSLPWTIAKGVLSGISLPVMILYPIGTLLLGKLMVARLRRKKEGDTLLHSEARWRSLTETSPDHILTLDANLNIQFANFAAPGLTVEELIGTPLYQYVEGEDRQNEIKAILESALLTGEQKSYETVYNIPDDGTIYYESTAVPRKLKNSAKIIGLTVSTRNITERKQAEEALKESKERLKETAMTAKVGGWETDLLRNTLSWTEETFRIYELESDQPLDVDKAIQYYHPEDQQIVAEAVQHAIEKGEGFDLEARLITLKNNLKWVRAIGNVTLNQGKRARLRGMIQDITDRKLAEKQIKASLKEKETLLQEIHHRVKNNMQVINSLLKLQANSIENDQIKEILKDSQSRVYAMSAVHETLHGSENLSEIDLKSYLSKITTSIFQTYSTNHCQVKLNSNIEDSPISINQAYPLGLIINELISNSLKYAFPGKKEGEITASMNKLDKELELTIMDNGVGMQKDYDWKNSNTLGLKLVRTLVENQLDGSIDMDNDNGTKFTIKFNIET